MDAVVLGWDPDRGSLWTTSYEDCVRRCGDDHRLLQRAPVGDWHLAATGTRAYLMLQGRHRGMIGRGIVRSAPFLSADPARPGQMIHHVLVEWDTLLPLERPIPVEALEVAVPQVRWRSGYAPAVRVTAPAAQQLELIWAANAAGRGRRRTRNALGFLLRR